MGFQPKDQGPNGVSQIALSVEHYHFYTGRPFGIVINSMRGFDKCIFIRLVNIDELLRITIDQGKPGILDLYHDSMPGFKRVGNVGYFKRNGCNFTGHKGLRIFKTVPEATP